LLFRNVFLCRFKNVALPFYRLQLSLENPAGNAVS
jgi:hypothetical protein